MEGRGSKILTGWKPTEGHILGGGGGGGGGARDGGKILTGWKPTEEYTAVPSPAPSVAKTFNRAILFPASWAHAMC